MQNSGENPNDKLSTSALAFSAFDPLSPEIITDVAPEKLISKLLERDSESEKYIVEDKISQGGMGAIYRVFDQDLRRASVLKVVLPGVMEDTLLFRRFIEEAQITGKLEHPNIVPVHDLGVIQRSKLYFSMKYVQGQGLGSILKNIRDGKEEYTEHYKRYVLLTIFRKVCDAVAYAHSKGIIHRDIKPDNIMVGEYGEVLLMDWGLARPAKTGSGQDWEDDYKDQSSDMVASEVIKTQFGVVKGTPTYMSPEQAKGQAGEMDHRSDIFLLGATLYAMITLQVPYSGRDVYDVLENAENGNYIRPGKRAPEQEIPEELSRIIEKAMAYSKADRYQSVEELTTDLDLLMAGNTHSLRKKFEPDEFLIREGESGHEAYVIITGKVEVTKKVSGKAVSLITLKEGDVIGEMALILQEPRSATVQAVEKTEVFVINEESMKQCLGQLSPWMGTVVDSLAQRLRTANVKMHPLMSEDCSYHVLNQLRLIYCHWSTPKIVPATGEAIAIIDTGKTAQEIATNLSISKEKVLILLSLLLDFSLLKPYEKKYFFIPNFELFCQFIEYIQKQIRLRSEFKSEDKFSFFADNDEFMVRRSTKKNINELSNLKRMHSQAPASLLDYKNEAEKQEKFSTILSQLKEVSNKNL